MSDKYASLSEREVGYSEALANWMTRYLDPSGFECQLSIEAETGAEVLKKAESAIAFLTESKCIPLHQANHNGNGQGKESKLDTPTDTKQERQSGSPLCPIHGIEMKLWSKGERSWYSHRWEGGWCKGGLS